MKILLLSILFLLNGQVLIADENNEKEILDKIESCGVLYTEPIRVKPCKLSPDTDELLKCGEFFRGIAPKQETLTKEDEYREFASKSEKRVQEAWNKGGKMMIEREPITKKERCGYYLDCLTSYVETLPMFAPDGRPLKHEQFESWQQYDKILL